MDTRTDGPFNETWIHRIWKINVIRGLSLPPIPHWGLSVPGTFYANGVKLQSLL